MSYFRKDESGFEIFVAVLLMVVLAVGLAPLGAGALAFAWNKLIVPTWGVAPIVWRQAMTASFLFTFVRLNLSDSSTDGKSVWGYLGSMVFAGFYYPGVVVLFTLLYGLWL